ncbi:MAG TPA: GntR family transcriptional regulator [Pirellulales bacterium]|jgi:DNA-binding GntR family transcriptional regulator|nr:GntR family transcriptional regulator [Pirellulales bacterium]
MVLTLKQHAYKLIRNRVLSGSIPPGGRLSDDALSKELKISRSPIREAISQLTSEGLVEYRPRSGAYVRVPDLRELEEWYETRTALEGFAVMRACSHITAVQLGELQRLCDEIAAVIRAVRELPGKIANTKLRERFLALDLEFHMLILHVSGNAWMLRIVEDCKLLTKVFGHVQIEHDMRLLSRSHLGHRRVVRALRRQQPEFARRLMEEHIQAACRAVLAGYAAKRAAPDESI